MVSSSARPSLPLTGLLAVAAALCWHCGHPEGSPPAAAVPRSDTPAVPGVQPVAVAPAPRTVSPEEAQKPRNDLPPDKRALLVVNGAERWVSAEDIESVGYTLVDLRDDWTPSIFAEEHTPDGEPMPNRYRRVLLGLSNDQLDNDGEPLEQGNKNYLELYGAFPSFSVLRARFMHDLEHPCHDQESADTLAAVETVSYVAPDEIRRDELKVARITKELETARRNTKAASLQELAQKKPELAAKVALVEKRPKEKLALAAVEKRLACEGLLQLEGKHKRGIYDEPMRLAVRTFQQKHMIYESNYLRRRTVEALARPLLDNDYDSVVRGLRERVVSAASIIEDGTGGTTKEPGRNLVDEYTQKAVEQLGLVDAQSTLQFFQRHPPEDFRTLRAAVKLPERPAYYGKHMDLSIVVDRGDVWYDLPFDANGNFSPHGRKRFPSLTLYTTHNGEKIPLARWRSTIGGWRAEQASDGYEYFRYKMSDVGPRVIRQIVSGPVWIAPVSTPIRGLVKGKRVNGKAMKIVNYDELGPGYLSAYGLVAGYFVIPGENGKPDYDNGVRAHGSSDYLSIYSSMGYSHGCHRLPNHIAIRLYSFILNHRNKTIGGDQPLSFNRQFLQNDRVYEIRITSRGFAYYLDPPLPVNVLEGDIKGAQKKPILGYVPKPNEIYPGPPPALGGDGVEAKAGN
ncbi:MAG: hypothetical protein ABW321_33000 [Polyangiales bacterium]